MSDMKEKEIFQTDLNDVAPVSRGKVRDIYDLGDTLLIVATDRVSAFDCVMPNGIPGRGKVLTEMSLFWFGLTEHLVANHLITADVGEFPENLRPFADQLEGRSMLVKKASRIDVECVARGYLAGSGWKEYQVSETVCGVELPPGLVESSRLPEAIFTPASKADSGHDENISFEQMCEVVDPDLAATLRDLTLSVYGHARDYADTRGIILADTKFEFGKVDGEIILIDEILSPDSSRFWDKNTYAPGKSQDSFDKQIVRNYLETLDWDKAPPAPGLPRAIVDRTLARYREVRDRLLN